MLTQLYVWIWSWLRRDAGQDLAEYALLIGLIALAVIAAVRFLGVGLSDTFDRIAAIIETWAVPP